MQLVEWAMWQVVGVLVRFPWDNEVDESKGIRHPVHDRRTRY